MTFLASAQTGSDSPQFEAASVKPVPHGTPYGGMRGGPGTSSPGEIRYDAVTLRAVVATAYGVQRFQIVGPRWFDDERFEIVAKILPGTTLPRFQLMLQGLLAERFHLELHKETRPLSAYEITVARSGLKMRPAPLPETPPLPASDTSAPTSSGMQWSTAGENVELRGRSITMRQILVWLNGETHREIVDKTGMKGAYDFDMSWTLDTSNEPSDSFGADILDAALEKYLGLKVVARKVPVEMLVIDRLDRTPVEN